MSYNKPAIRLSWAPKVPPLSSAMKLTSEKLQMQPSNTVSKHDHELVDGLFVPPRDPRKLNKLLKKQVKDTTVEECYGSKAALQEGRAQTLSKYIQVGTVSESASDFFSGRLTKKERKATLADQLLSYHSLGDYRKRKVREIEGQHCPVGVDKWKIRGPQTRKRAKQRRL